jgi:hypothetical protein
VNGGQAHFRGLWRWGAILMVLNTSAIIATPIGIDHVSRPGLIMSGTRHAPIC